MSKNLLTLTVALLGLCATTPLQADHHEAKPHCSDKSCTCTPKDGKESEDGKCTCDHCECEGCKEHGKDSADDKKSE
jgi:hypothetical protein